MLEYYAEAVIPVTSRFDLNAAVRGSDYDLFDTESVFKVGAKLSPVDTLTIRASFSEGFRAPNIGELFNLPFESPFPVADPCSRAMGDDRTELRDAWRPSRDLSPSLNVRWY